jgi:hypothetical protein
MPKCCGQPVGHRRPGHRDDEPLPPNPKIPGGKPMLYLGWGRRELKGVAIGSTYCVNNKRRKFTAAPADVPTLVSREVIKKGW